MQIGAAPTKDKPSELVADKGYHSRAVLKTLDDGAWKTRIAEPKQSGFSRWRGDDKARVAVYANRTRLGSGIGKKAMRRRAEIVERSFAHNLDRGGMRRTWLRGRENIHKRYLVHVAGHNLGILMRLLIGAGTPREAVAQGWLPICSSLTPRRPWRSSSSSPRPTDSPSCLWPLLPTLADQGRLRQRAVRRAQRQFVRLRYRLAE